MKELLPQKEEDVVNLMSPLVWAYIGDAVYEVYIRTYLINTTKLNAHMLHVKAIQYVKAGAQAKALQAIHEKLTDKEKEIVRRARNTKKTSCSQKCRSGRLCLCNCFRRINWLPIFNQTK